MWPYRWIAAGAAALVTGGAILLGRKTSKAASPSPGITPPSPSPRMPGAIDDYAPMEMPENICDPTEKPGVVAFRRYVLQRYGGTDLGIIRACGGKNSGHTAGRAWDWGVLNNNAQVETLLNDLFANQDELIRRTGIMYLIYNRRIWNTRSKVWQNYTGENPHTDHVHFSFSEAGAMGRTSFYQNAIA